MRVRERGGGRERRVYLLVLLEEVREGAWDETAVSVSLHTSCDGECLPRTSLYDRQCTMRGGGERGGGSGERGEEGEGRRGESGRR